MTTIYDVFINLINLIQDIMPAVIAIAGILIGKWMEKRNENEKLKREIYLEANRALSRYRDIYLATALNISDKNIQRLHEQQMLIGAAKADLEILGSDKAVKLYSDCLKFIDQIKEEMLSKKQKGETSINIANNIKEIPSYKNFFNSWCKWNDINRKDLGIIK
jgi:hypothetical protein